MRRIIHFYRGCFFDFITKLYTLNMFSGLSFKFSESQRAELSSVTGVERNSLGIFTLARTYARMKDNGRSENFFEICERVTCGLYSLVDGKLPDRSSEFFELMYKFKMTPPGRGFWSMGTELVHKDRVGLPLVNCTFISSENIATVKDGFFRFIMDALMLGVGVGFDDRGAGKISYSKPTEPSGDITVSGNYTIADGNVCDVDGIPYTDWERKYENSHFGNKHVVGDSRGGWVAAVGELIKSYLCGGEVVLFDYSQVRKRGIPLKKFGGTSSGPDPLSQGIAIMRRLLETNDSLTSLLICDLANIIATIVVAGNVRRSSEIFISSNPEMFKYKDTSVYPYRAPWSWASNNSFVIDDDRYLETIQEQIKLNGEPGVFNMNNARNYGRMCDAPDYKDVKINGTNPCGEISLEGFDAIGSEEEFSAGGETCNIFETYPSNYEGSIGEVIKKFGEDLYHAVLYCKAVTTVEPHWGSTAAIQNRNRRIGISQTGIQLFIAKHNLSLEKYGVICDYWYSLIKEYDFVISEALGIPRSIKLTTVKPSGTVSICGGVPSGMHCPISNHYIRRVRYSRERREFTKLFELKKFHVEQDVWQPSTLIVSFPVKLAHMVKTRMDITIEEQFELAVLLQERWSDNQVSCTITFKPEEADKIAPLMKKHFDKIKGISFLALDCTAYAQAPEEVITEAQYEEMYCGELSYADFGGSLTDDIETDNYCDGDQCLRS
jgi:ribonucleoside-triphosphate reductase (thioredoxin)